jgi:hypothetical protein
MSFTTNGEIKFTKSIRTRAIGCQVIQISEKTTNTVITEGVTVDWVEINGQIIIRHISGLKPNTTYNVRLLVV